MGTPPWLDKGGITAAWEKLANGKRVMIRGHLFNRQTGHHHARVLIEAKTITEARK